MYGPLESGVGDARASGPIFVPEGQPENSPTF